MEKDYLPHRFGATDFKDLHRNIFVPIDQYLLIRKKWDYKNPELFINRIYQEMLRVDRSVLSEADRIWCDETLWLWNHHAISSAIWLHRDLAAALAYANTALSYQESPPTNYLTKVFALLLEDKLEEARELASTVTNGDREVCEETINICLNGWWYEQFPAT